MNWYHIRLQIENSGFDSYTSRSKEQEETILASIKIVIEVDAAKKDICITDDAGNEKHLQSVILCGGDATTREFYLFGWGSASDAAWALANSFRATQDPFYKRVFVHFTQWVAQFMGFDTRQKNVVEGDELADRWDEEDKEKAEKDKLKWN